MPVGNPQLFGLDRYKVSPYVAILPELQGPICQLMGVKITYVMASIHTEKQINHPKVGNILMVIALYSPWNPKLNGKRFTATTPPQGGAPLVLCINPINCFAMCMHRTNMDKPIKHTEPIVFSWLWTNLAIIKWSVHHHEQVISYSILLHLNGFSTC